MISNIFQHPNWQKTLQETYGYKTKKFLEGDSEITLMEVNRFISKKYVAFPFSDWCFENEKIDIKSLPKDQKFQIRGGICDENFITEKFLVHDISLIETEDEIFMRFEGKTRRNIKKAIKNNLDVNVLTDKDSLKIFMQHNYETRRKHGLPPQPDSFFENFYKNIISEKMGATVIVSQKGTPVSSSILMFWDENVYYKYGASDPNYLNLRPNDLMFWEIIKWAKGEGFKNLNLGKTDIDAEGLIRFKRSLGTTVKTINYYEFPKSQDSDGEGESIIKKLEPHIQKMPIGLLRFIGNSIYKYFG